MPNAPVSKRLQTTIIAYSALGMFVVGVTVGLVGVLPLATRLREAQKSSLLVDLQKRTVVIEQSLTRIRGTATAGGGRTDTRRSLDAYNRGHVSLAEMRRVVDPLLEEALKTRRTNLAGILIFDAQSNLVAKAGASLPAHLWPPWPDPAARETTMLGPFRLGGETFITAGATIFLNNTSLERIGTAMTLAKLDDLQKVVEDYRELGRTGQIILGSRQNKNLPIFFPLRETRKGKGSSADPKYSAAVMEGLQRAEEHRTDLFEPEFQPDRPIVAACGPIRGTDWGLVVTMTKAELFASINRNLIILSTVIVALIGLGTFGMVVLLRPLAGRVILHTDELESQIYEKTAALNTELSERKRAEKSLRDSEALYHSLVDTLPINILRKDLRGRVTYGNRGYCERMGRPLPELLGKTDYDLFPRENADKYLTDDERVIRSGEMFEDIEEHRAGDGQKLYVHVLKAPVRNAKGDVVGTQVIFWDVTARKLAEEALEKTAAELARSNKELEQFAYVASHDLQEPLRMITSYTQLIAKRYKEQLDSDAKEFMHYAVDGATRMQKLIQGLLEYSRVGTRGKPFVQTRCDEILTSALANLKLAIEEAGATVTHDPLPEIISDPVQLTQLFQNLIGNALKFRGKDAPRIHVAVERRARADAATLNVPPYEWIFRVSDNGIGIEPQYYERIFVIFQRLHTQDKYPGTGIGLAICKKIVERHGGRIWLESRLGEGTTFFFALPALD
jgi:PAS domain S-box-containing protein